MRLSARNAFISLSVMWFAFLLEGCLSRLRDFSSPPITIRVVDQKNSPVSGVEVVRDWDDSDCLMRGSDTNKTDTTGTVLFSKIPAQVQLFTGAWRKAHDNLAPRGSSSGTQTRILIRLAGIYDVKPAGGSLHKIEVARGLYEDKDGVVFYTSFDSKSNTTTEITFPVNCKVIDYVVSATPSSP